MSSFSDDVLTGDDCLCFQAKPWAGSLRSTNATALYQASSFAPNTRRHRVGPGSVESLTSICTINVEMTAIRQTTRSRGFGSALRKLGAVFSARKGSQYDHRWGWHEAVRAIAASPPDHCEMKGGLDSPQDEADLPGWDHCGVIYGNGIYTDGEES